MARRGWFPRAARLAGLALLAAGLAAPAAAQETVKIGVVGPRTGAAAATGKAFEEASSWPCQVNAAGGVLGKKIEVVFEENRRRSGKAASGIEKLSHKARW